MKIGTGYTPPILPQQRVNALPQDQTGDRNSAEAKLRELIAQKHAEFETYRPVEELGKHLDLRA
jgi:hypothetical protein